uniref:Cilia- and flagella-associated protein 206 n=1 Tax=Chlamydomonas leiostraca TaxID=1034604 RepID=A0A7S0R8C7_9CHLO|mmetsp:Transcript_15714/g.39196  ORF Transcript_15714/g.39196 Transcript_15714/m.39196 type:complete len:498 (+) Transcript_15714:151-1644(+)|eukprot:CAMPEP_0202867916 /NCGR_PEP_ID=MMETSP1391-20130828/9737_1 /ASSEMBLY_ACC=CAM_ASM_000867 /TAXON_ID=1034604 /ORGANISM="Chlamydomonas leiostraca, Strain SAG 11-49" /LENGTH=497 /DNA_ID=CAMNT_0049547999 /DNA_START=141 /DNA_END=1634 /DNA_ORIENTATION=+
MDQATLMELVSLGVLFLVSSLPQLQECQQDLVELDGHVECFSDVMGFLVEHGTRLGKVAIAAEGLGIFFPAGMDARGRLLETISMAEEAAAARPPCSAQVFNKFGVVQDARGWEDDEENMKDGKPAADNDFLVPAVAGINSLIAAQLAVGDSGNRRFSNDTVVEAMARKVLLRGESVRLASERRSPSDEAMGLFCMAAHRALKHGIMWPSDMTPEMDAAMQLLSDIVRALQWRHLAGLEEVLGELDFEVEADNRKLPASLHALFTKTLPNLRNLRCLVRAVLTRLPSPMGQKALGIWQLEDKEARAAMQSAFNTHVAGNSNIVELLKGQIRQFGGQLGAVHSQQQVLGGQVGALQNQQQVLSADMEAMKAAFAHILKELAAATEEARAAKQAAAQAVATAEEKELARQKQDAVQRKKQELLTNLHNVSARQHVAEHAHNARMVQGRGGQGAQMQQAVNRAQVMRHATGQRAQQQQQQLGGHAHASAAGSGSDDMDTE